MSMDRMTVPREEVINEMKKTDFHNVEAVRRFHRLTDAVAAPDFEYDGVVPVMTPRQWYVARAAFVKAVDKNLERVWWEMYDFVTAKDDKNMTQLEMQMLCLMLEVWISIADEGKPILIQ